MISQWKTDIEFAYVVQQQPGDVIIEPTEIKLISIIEIETIQSMHINLNSSELILFKID